MARVLLVEDDDAIRTSLSKALTAAGHVVTAVAGGADGVAAVARDKPDVLLLDLGLPDLDGRDVLAMVRSVSDVPVIVATARDDDASPVDLTRKEFDLLLALSRRPGAVVTKRELLAEVWGLPWGGGDRTVDVHLSWLRRKLGETAAQPRFLHSVRGVGIKLAAPESGN